jgi:hypothetical protein
MGMELMIESQFSKTLLFHQALGFGAIRYVEHHVQEHEINLCAELSIFLHLLLPKASDGEILKAASKFILKALALKVAMTKEQSVYRGFWSPSGEQFDADSMELADEESGLVYLCTFPGLARTIKREKETGKEIINAVKSKVVLSSSLTWRVR